MIGFVKVGNLLLLLLEGTGDASGKGIIDHVQQQVVAKDENLSEQLATLDDALSADPATLSGLDLGALLVDPGSEAAAGNAQ